jgi:hypothetical protein
MRGYFRLVFGCVDGGGGAVVDWSRSSAKQDRRTYAMALVAVN